MFKKMGYPWSLFQIRFLSGYNERPRDENLPIARGTSSTSSLAERIPYRGIRQVRYKSLIIPSK